MFDNPRLSFVGKGLLIHMKSSSVGLGLVHSTFMNKTFMMHMSVEIYKPKTGKGETLSIYMHSKGDIQSRSLTVGFEQFNFYGLHSACYLRLLSVLVL